jgi:hypothetical protein
MQNWMKRSLLVLGVFGTCWIGAVWYWRSTTRMPDTGDLALAMLVVPLTLVAGYWLAKKTFGGSGETAPASAPSAPAAKEPQSQQDGTAVAGAQDAAEGQSQAPWMPFRVAGAALRLPHGDSPAELAAAFADGKARLDLDHELTDAQGFPLLAGRVPEVDLVPLEGWLSSLHPASRPMAARQLRAMAMGGDVAGNLAALAVGSGSDGVLQLLPLIPADWPQAAQETAARWLAHRAVEAGWPQDRLKLRLASPATPLAALRALSSQAAGPAESVPALSIVLAFDSSIDPDAVENLAVNGKLYSPRNPKGRMPAEGAAGILLQPPAQAGNGLHLLALNAKDSSALNELAKDALEQARGAAPAYVAADTDHLAAAMSDLMQCIEANAPELDTNTSLACIGAACGHTGAAGALAAIALANEQALESGGFALALSNAEPTQRFALLVGPLPAPASKTPSLS